MINSRLFIFLIVFIDLLGFGLILQLLPHFAEAYGATPFVVGLLVASYADALLLGAPFLGWLSDGIGRRPVLLLSAAAVERIHKRYDLHDIYDPAVIRFFSKV